MPDIRLEVGVAVGASYKSMKEDLTGIVNALNKQPRKIQLNLDLAHISKDANALKTQLTDIQKQASNVSFGTDLAKSLDGVTSKLNEVVKSLETIGKSSGFGAVSSTVETLKSELSELRSAISGFQGVSINLGLSGGKNAVQKMAEYGSAAKQTIGALKSEVLEYERIIADAMGGATAAIEQNRSKVMQLANYGFNNPSSSKIVGLKPIAQTSLKATDQFTLMNNLGGATTSAKQAMEVYSAYRTQLIELANAYNIDLTPAVNTGTTAMVESTQKMLTGEQDVETGMERLKSIFGSGVNAEALTEQLTGIRTAIDGVNEAISKIGSGAESFTGFKQSIEDIVTKIQELITAVNQINLALNNITPTRQVIDPSAMKEMVSETQSEVQASGDLQSSINRLNELLAKQTEMMEEANNARAQELADLELERMAEEEAAAASRQANTALQDQINAMTGVDAETKSARESAEVFKAAEQEQAAAQRDAAAAAKEQAAAQREAAAEQKHIDSVITSYNNALVTGTDRLRQWSAAEYSRNSATRDAYHAISSSVEAMRSAKAEYDSGTGSIETLESRIREFRNTLKESEVTIKSSGDATKTFGERIGSLAQKFSYWFSITRVIMYVVRTIRQMITNVKEMDEAFTQLQIVTRATESAIKSFGNSVAASAKKVGSSITDLVNSATTYARLGYSLTESGVLAEYTAMLQNVGDIEVSDAQDAITAIVKAFNIDADNIEEIMDKLVTVGNNFPISVSQIAEGMNNAASSLAAAGNTFEQSVALLTAANTTVQNISKASTGLRTITARLRNTTVDLEELGEEMTEAKYEELVSALTDAKVKLTDVNGEYRSTYDIMSDLAAKWGELSDMTKSALATSIGGTRMQNIFYSIINSFQEASGAMDAMKDSEGALAEANQTYLDSIEGRAKVLQATFQEFSEALIGSDLVKNATSFLTTLLEILNSVVSFVDYIGGLPTLLLAVSTALTLVIGGLIAYRAQIIATTIVTKLSTILTGLHTALMNIVYAIPNAIVAWKSYAAGVVSASTAMQASIPILGILLVAVTAITIAINAHNSALEEQAQKNMETAKSAASLSDEISDLAMKYIELSNAVKSDKSVKDQLISTQEELIDKLDIEKSRIAELTEQYGNYTDAIKAATVEKLKEKEIDIQGGINDFEDAVIKAAKREFWGTDLNTIIVDMKATTDAYEENLEAFEALEDAGFTDAVDKIQAGLTNGGLDKYQTIEAYYDYDLSTIEGIRKAYEKTAEVLRYLRDNGYGDTDVYRAYYNGYNELSEAIGDYDTAIDSLNENLSQQYMLNALIGKEVPKTASEFQAFRNGLVSSAVASGAFIGSEKDIADSIDDVLSKQAQFAQFYDDTTDAVDTATESYKMSAEKLDELKDEIDSISSALDDVQSAYSTLAGVIDDYNEKGYFSLDNLQDLIDLEPEYLNLLIDENGQLNLNTQTYYAYIEAKAKSLVLDKIKSLYEDVLAMTVEEAQAYANAEAYDTETDSLVALTKAMTSAYAVKAQMADAENHTTAYTEAFTRATELAANYVSIYDNMIQNLSTSENELSSSTSSATDALEEQKDALEDTLDAVEDAQSAITSLIDRVIDYIKKQKELEKEALQDQKDAFDDIIEAEKERLKLKYEEIEADKTLANLENSVAKDALAASIAALDDSSAGKKAQKEANDNLVSSRQDLYDELAEREYNTRVDALDALKEAQDDYYDSEIEKIEDYLSKERQIYEDACYMIDHDTGDLYDKLWDYTYNYTTETRAEFDYMWNEAQSALGEYRDANMDLLTVLETMQTDIYRISREIDILDEAISNESGTVDNLASSWANATANALAYKQALADEVNNSKKWYFRWNGKEYWSTAEDKTQATIDIMKLLKEDLGWDDRAGGFVRNSLKHYASGTNNASGGLSVVGERGAELRVLNRGDGILPSQITKGLAALGANPGQFIADASAKLLNSLRQTNSSLVPAITGVTSNQSMPINIVNNIQGDVNPQTLRELQKYQKQTVKDAVKEMMSQALTLRTTSRVR